MEQRIRMLVNPASCSKRLAKSESIGVTAGQHKVTYDQRRQRMGDGENGGVRVCSGYDDNRLRCVAVNLRQR